MQREELRHRVQGFFATFRSRTLWLIAGVLFCYFFSPGFGTPLYFHMTDRLGFSQVFIAALSSVSAAGWIAGGLPYCFALAGMETRVRSCASALSFGVVSTLAYLALLGPSSAVIVYFVGGVAAMIANNATLTLAAEHCPKGAEGFAFAALMSVINLAAPLHDTVGALLYEHLFNERLGPLIIVSAGFTAFVLVLLKMVDMDRTKLA